MLQKHIFVAHLSRSPARQYRYVLVRFGLNSSALFADNIFRCIFVNETFCNSVKISLNVVPNRSIENNPALVQTTAWCRIGDKPLWLQLFFWNVITTEIANCYSDVVEPTLNVGHGWITKSRIKKTQKTIILKCRQWSQIYCLSCYIIQLYDIMPATSYFFVWYFIHQFYGMKYHFVDSIFLFQTYRRISCFGHCNLEPNCRGFVTFDRKVISKQNCQLVVDYWP